MEGRNWLSGILSGVFLAIFCLGSLWAGLTIDPVDEPLATVNVGTRGIQFRPKVVSSGMILSVSRPDGTVFQQTFDGSATPYFELSGDATDGTYTYELRSIPALDRKLSRETDKEISRFSARTKGVEEELRALKANVQTGYFRVMGGRIVTGGGAEAIETPPDSFTIQDVLHYDDVIITGSLAVGFDAADGESFGFDTIRLKEHNLRIHFDDTSYTGSYPSNSWRIIINDSTNGGANYFSIEDSDDGVRPFTIEAGAPANSLYVEDYGRVGLGTSTPVVELHVKDSDTPTLRLEQDSSGGWTAQTFDVGANESNFFIRDATNGSKLPFRIQPSTPSSTLCLKSDGNVGIGTWSPAYPLELETTSENAAIVAQRTDGATNYINATATHGNFGTVTNHPLRLAVNSVWRMRLDNDNSLTMASGATCTSGGAWQNYSSRASKENIHNLSTEEAMNTLEGLVPVKFNYKVDKEEKCVGFIAEDVPELVATKDRKGMSPMDVVAVLTKVVQDQQKTISEQQKALNELRQKITALEGKSRTEK